MHDSIDVASGGLGTQFETFAVEANKWQRWWFQIDTNRYFKLYDLNDVVLEEGPRLLAAGRLGYNSESSRITIGDSSSTVGIDSDMLIDEVYVLDSFRDVAAVPWGDYPDFDNDGDVDQFDWGRLEDCASGPEIPYPPGCEEKDLDEDGDIDQEDFGLFQRCFVGVGGTPIPGCADLPEEQ